MPQSKGAVFNIDLKQSNESQDLMCNGRLFHRRGAATEKARSPFQTVIWEHVKANSEMILEV